MSLTNTYYLGYLDDDSNVIHPLGPFDKDGNIISIVDSCDDIFEYSNSIFLLREISDNTEFSLNKEEWGEDIDISLGYRYFCYLNELPNESYIHNGYFLYTDVIKYLKEPGFIISDKMVKECIPPDVFALKALNEITSGKSKEERPCMEYVFFSLINKYSPEYYASKIRNMAAYFRYDKRVKEDMSNVVLVVRMY